MLHESSAGEKIIVANDRTAELARCIVSHAADALQIHAEPSQIIGNYVRVNERVNENK